MGHILEWPWFLQASVSQVLCCGKLTFCRQTSCSDRVKERFINMSMNTHFGLKTTSSSCSDSKLDDDDDDDDGVCVRTAARPTVDQVLPGTVHQHGATSNQGHSQQTLLLP